MGDHESAAYHVEQAQQRRQRRGDLRCLDTRQVGLVHPGALGNLALGQTGRDAHLRQVRRDLARLVDRCEAVELAATGVAQPGQQLVSDILVA